MKEYKWVKEKPKEVIYYWCKEKGWSLKPHLEEHWVIREIGEIQNGN